VTVAQQPAPSSTEERPKARKPAAITGIGAVSPLGVGATVLHENWAAGISGLEDGIGVCSEFDGTDIMSRKEARRTHRMVHLALMAAEEAIQTAWGGGDEPPYDPTRIPCILGCAFGGLEAACEQYEVFQTKGADAVSILTIPIAMSNAPAALIAMKYGIRGESFSISCACSSSANAIGEGLNRLREDKADAVIVGGTEACTTEFLQASFGQAGAMSKTGRSLPFDRRRDGFVMGEGAAIMVLEDADKARERGADILGYVAGYASTTDGYHLTAPEPSGEIAAAAITQALADAGLRGEDVDYVNAHGTGTPLNDKAETVALKRALGQRAYEIPVSAPKSVLGHSIGAAGAVEAVATVQALRQREAPPTVGYEEPDEELDLDYVPDESRRLHPRNEDGRLVAVSNSFAFGGHNATVVITTP
jgi:3-oxoacyl-[acyl-carrier-protein] synthase II